MNIPVRIFQTLAEGIDFISRCLEQNAPDDLYAQFGRLQRQNDSQYEHFVRQNFVRTIFPDLHARHLAADIRTIYQGREFPTNEDNLHLGGHFAELGCIHIIFVRAPQGWVLDEILMCR